MLKSAILIILITFTLSSAVTIGEIRANYSSYENKEVTIEGILTCPGGTFNKQSFYVQDATGGILCYQKGGDFSTQVLGDQYSVIGKVSKYNEEIEILITTAAKKGAGTPPDPKKFTTKSANSEEAGGWLCRISGTVSDVEQANRKFNLDDGSGKVMVYIDGNINESINWTIIQEGAQLTIVGIGVNYRGTYEIKPRFNEDIREGTGFRRTTWGNIKGLYMRNQ